MNRRLIVRLPWRADARELRAACVLIVRNAGQFGGIRAGIPQVALAVLSNTNYISHSPAARRKAAA